MIWRTARCVPMKRILSYSEGWSTYHKRFLSRDAEWLVNSYIKRVNGRGICISLMGRVNSARYTRAVNMADPRTRHVVRERIAGRAICRGNKLWGWIYLFDDVWILFWVAALLDLLVLARDRWCPTAIVDGTCLLLRLHLLSLIANVIYFTLSETRFIRVNENV